MAPSKESFRFSTQDASFLYGETANAPLNMSMLATFRSRIDFKSLFAHLDARMPRLPRYRQRVVLAPFNLAHPSLADDPGFDLANHLFCHELPGDSTQATLMKAVMRVYEKPLDRGKPLWELHLFNSRTGGHSTILTKIQHCLADGISGMEMLAVITSTRPKLARRHRPTSPGRRRRCQAARHCLPQRSLTSRARESNWRVAQPARSRTCATSTRRCPRRRRPCRRCGELLGRS